MPSFRSLQASTKGIMQVRAAQDERSWTVILLAQKAKVARSTVNNFREGRPIDRKIFVRLCELLELNWQQIANMPSDELDLPIFKNIDVLIQQLRDQVRADIQKRCGTMRVLDMTQPIDANTIYTDVNILEKVTGKSRAEIPQLMQNCGPENFDRFFLGNVRHKRLNGLEAIDQHNLLMILGRPGAGKTTFLKRLAMWCIAEEKFADRVPVFVTLKEFADCNPKTGLLDFIGNAEAIQQVLEAGRGLVLLDGLDEVQAAEHDRILAEIRDFARIYDHNTIIITCRIAAREYIFEQFTEVEIADFNREQIADFVTKWFKLKNPNQAALFLERLETSNPIQELATNPLLLTLLCLEFEEVSDFPASRAELYERGINILLTKWDGQRGIKRDVVYQKLSTKRKESLLADLAFYTFARGDYFFKQAVAERQISLYIKDLPDAKTDPAALLLDSHAVLKSIENQHGLLTERATGIYSFSHLTFHEYFVAKHLTEHPERKSAIHKLLEHTAESHWREIFLLATEQLEPADDLLQGLKARVNEGLKDDSQLQSYLRWVQVKSSLVCSELNAWEARNFYFNLALDLDRSLSLPLALDLALDLDLSRALDRAPKLSLDFSRALERSFELARDFEHARNRDRDDGLSLDLARDIDYDSTHERDSARNRARDNALSRTLSGNRVRAFDLNLTSAQDRINGLARDLYQALNRDFACEPEFKEQLRQLYDTLPNRSKENVPNLQDWLISNCEEWVSKLRQIAIEYRNIGHNWQFTEVQYTKLLQYYKTNQLLIDCLNSECRISRSVREEIEETLFLPLEAIERF